MSGMIKMVVLGGPTFKELCHLVEDINLSGKGAYEVIALLDDNEELHGTHISGIEVKGPLQMAHDFPGSTVFALAINNNKRRIQRMEILNNLELPYSRFPALIHPTAVIESSARISNGCQIFQFCSIANGVVIGEFSMLSPYSLCALDSHLDSGVLTGARVTVLGKAQLGACSFIGSGSLVVENVVVGSGAFVGAGSLLMQNLKPGHFTMGNPASQQVRNIHVPESIISLSNVFA